MRLLNYPNLTKYMKKYIKGTNSTKIKHQKHKTIRTTTDISPWHDQEYKVTERGGGGWAFLNHAEIVFRQSGPFDCL